VAAMWLADARVIVLVRVSFGVPVVETNAPDPAPLALTNSV